MHNLQPWDQARELAVVEEMVRTGTVVALQVGTGRMHDHQESIRGEFLCENLEEGPPEEANAHDEVPGSRREALRLKVDGERPKRKPGRARFLEGDRKRHGGDVGEGRIEPTLRQPERAGARTTGHVQRAASDRQ